MTAAAAVAAGVVGTLAVVRPDAEPPAPEPTVVASAPLAAYGATPKDANGAARVLGDNQLRLHVANLPKVPGYYEVWLIDPKTMQMFSVGTLKQGSFDNKPAHSGDSLLRGTLTG